MTKNQHKSFLIMTTAKNATKLACIGASLAAVTMFLPELVLAANLDIDAGVKAATDPLIKAIDHHWGKGVLVCSAASGLFGGEGDLRQRAVRSGMGGVISGAFFLGLLKLFG